MTQALYAHMNNKRKMKKKKKKVWAEGIAQWYRVQCPGFHPSTVHTHTAKCAPTMHTILSPDISPTEMKAYVHTKTFM
jgi:hypothetical protein